VAEVDVRGGRVDPQLHAQRAALVELALELALGQRLDGIAEQECGGFAHGRRC
jgi:hypothetical protein